MKMELKSIKWYSIGINSKSMSVVVHGNAQLKIDDEMKEGIIKLFAIDKGIYADMAESTVDLTREEINSLSTILTQLKNPGRNELQHIIDSDLLVYVWESV